MTPVRRFRSHPPNVAQVPRSYHFADYGQEDPERPDKQSIKRAKRRDSSFCPVGAHTVYAKSKDQSARTTVGRKTSNCEAQCAAWRNATAFEDELVLDPDNQRNAPPRCRISRQE